MKQAARPSATQPAKGRTESAQPQHGRAACRSSRPSGAPRPSANSSALNVLAASSLAACAGCLFSLPRPPARRGLPEGFVRMGMYAVPTATPRAEPRGSVSALSLPGAGAKCDARQGDCVCRGHRPRQHVSRVGQQARRVDAAYGVDHGSARRLGCPAPRGD